MGQQKNVIDFYRYWETEAVKADLDTKRHNFTVLCCNINGDFNIGTIIRNANAFLSKEVVIFGKKNYDRRGAVGTQNYTNFKHVREINDLKSFLAEEDYYIVGIDNVATSKPIEGYNWPSDKKVLMVFGEEQLGIPKEVLDLCHETLYITQYGSVRSLNVGCASGIAMYSYCDHVNRK